MASQQQDKDVNVAVVVDGDGESSVGEGSPDRVLPLDALRSLVPECWDNHQDIPACAWETINDCVTEATVRLAFESANATVQDKRNVITAEDVTRAIEGLNDKDAAPGMVIMDMAQIMTAQNRATAIRRRQARRLRLKELAADLKAKEKELATEQKAKEQELAAEQKAKEEELAAEMKAKEQELAAEQKAKEEERASGAGLQD